MEKEPEMSFKTKCIVAIVIIDIILAVSVWVYPRQSQAYGYSYCEDTCVEVYDNDDNDYYYDNEYNPEYDQPIVIDQVYEEEN